MRVLVFAALLVLAAVPVYAHQDRIEGPQTLTVGFKTGDRATFTILNAAVTAITLHVGALDCEVPAAVCARLRDVRFESVALLWNGSSPSAVAADYAYLRFDMGTENARAFGELPRVELMFRGGKFDRATVTTKPDADSWQRRDLGE